MYLVDIKRLLEQPGLPAGDYAIVYYDRVAIEECVKISGPNDVRSVSKDRGIVC